MLAFSDLEWDGVKEILVRCAARVGFGLSQTRGVSYLQGPNFDLSVALICSFGKPFKPGVSSDTRKRKRTTKRATGQNCSVRVDLKHKVDGPWVVTSKHLAHENHSPDCPSSVPVPLTDTQFATLDHLQARHLNPTAIARVVANDNQLKSVFVARVAHSLDNRSSRTCKGMLDVLDQDGNVEHCVLSSPLSVDEATQEVFLDFWDGSKVSSELKMFFTTLEAECRANWVDEERKRKLVSTIIVSARSPECTERSLGRVCGRCWTTAISSWCCMDLQRRCGASKTLPK